MTDEAPQDSAGVPDREREDAEAEALALAHIADEPAYGDELIRQNNRTYAALVGVGLILIQPFVGSVPLDVAAFVCVIAFALAIPMLAGLIMLNAQESFRHRSTKSLAVTIAQQAALACAFIGIVAAFWHISWVAGVVVLAASIVGMSVHSVGWTRLEREALKERRAAQG